MNLNYVGSLAERKMRFRSFISGAEELETNIFNSISIYVPKSLAAKNLAEEYGEAIGTVSESKYIVTDPVTAANFSDVLAGNLLAQWKPIFNDGANIDVVLYVIVFDDSSFELSVTGTPTWKPLTDAFNDLYFISFFKTMFSEHYNGAKNPEEEPTYDDSKYFDMVLALSSLCENEVTLSYCLAEAHVVIPAVGSGDTNACKIVTQTRAEEEAHVTKLSGSNLQERAQYFWGYLNIINATHTMLIVHNGTYMIPIVLANWFRNKNASGEYIGNKLAKIRLTGNAVKPTGLPSPLNGAVNMNLPQPYYKNLDDKHIGYFMSIADDSLNNAELSSDRSISNFPTSAYMISKYIDYQTSQDVAKYASAQSTLTKPVLTNERAYKDIQSFLLSNIQKFTGTGRITNITTEFPPFSEVKKGNTIQGAGVWKAFYVDDLDSVNISGSIQF